MRLSRRSFIRSSTGVFLPALFTTRKSLAQWASFGDLAFMSQAAVAAGCTLANNWASRVVTNGGGTPSAGSKTSLCTFQAGLVTDSLDSLQVSWNAIASDNLIASITPQLKGPGTVDPWTNVGGAFVSGDLTASGLKGDGATKYLNTGIAPSGSGLTITDGGFTSYVTVEPGDAGVLLASNTNSGSDVFLSNFSGTMILDCWDGSGGQISAANAGFTGYASGNRTASNSIAIYEANSGIAHHTLVSASSSSVGNPAGNPFEITIFGWNIAGTVSSLSSKRLGFISIHHGYTSGQSALYYARVQTLMTAFGRQI